MKKISTNRKCNNAVKIKNINVKHQKIRSLYILSK